MNKNDLIRLETLGGNIEKNRGDAERIISLLNDPLAPENTRRGAIAVASRILSRTITSLDIWEKLRQNLSE